MKILFNSLYTLNFILFIFIVFSPLSAQKLVAVGDGYSKTSVNATVFRTNSLATWRDIQFIAYYDEDEYLVLGKRQLGNTEWQLNRTQYKGNCKDAHNVISIMPDGEGYLHVSFDHHGHPLNYCKSTHPGGLELGEKQSMIGDDEIHVTYPEFYRLKNGDLLFAYRSGSSGRGNLVLNQYHLQGQQWERIQNVLIDGEDQRNAYWQMYVDTEDIIHLSWVWREEWLVETNHDLCYARSKDKGKTWEKSNGEKYALPITATNAEYACRIPQNSELINQTSMTADRYGNPYIATYWRDQDSKTPQYRLVWFNGKKWEQQQVSNRSTPFSLSGGGTKQIPIARPQLIIKETKDKTTVCFIFRDEERNSKVSLYYANDLSEKNWKVKDLTTFSVDAWEPVYDTELWKEKELFHLFVQKVGQGDGEKSIQMLPQPIYVLEVGILNLLQNELN